MATLLSSSRLGNASASSLLKSATTLTREINAFNDEEARLTYENSAKTSSDLQAYTSYLNGRINTLKSSGIITDATKALTMGQDVISATHSNISADITRENINLMSQGMSGTAAGYSQKMDVVSSEYTRALSVGDDALAQSLMGQYYSLSQSYQQALSTAASASATLSSASATNQGEIVTNLTTALKSFTGTAKNLSENELNAQLGEWTKQNAGTLGTLGVKIQGSQPNYWDVVYGIAGAIYNAKVLQAQAESVSNPLVSETYAQEAQNYLNGSTKFSTLAGDLTVTQLQEAQQNPAMFAYDNTTGTYKQTQQTGYQYMTATDNNGQTSQVLVPSYSGIVNKAQYNKVFFLNPTQTTQMTKLGLNFSENKSGTTGNGVQVQLSQNSPQWLQNILGKNGVSNMFVDNKGFLQFKGGSTTGQGDSYFTLATDNKGLHGVFEHMPNGQTQVVGGDYGFEASAVQLLINQSQQQQTITAVKTAQVQQQLQLARQQAQKLSQISRVPVAQPAPTNTTSQAHSLQPAATPQLTFNPQPQTANPQGNTTNPQGGNFNPQQGGTNAGTLHVTSGQGIKL